MCDPDGVLSALLWRPFGLDAGRAETGGRTRLLEKFTVGNIDLSLRFAAAEVNRLIMVGRDHRGVRHRLRIELARLAAISQPETADFRTSRRALLRTLTATPVAALAFPVPSPWGGEQEPHDGGFSIAQIHPLLDHMHAVKVEAFDRRGAVASRLRHRRLAGANDLFETVCFQAKNRES